MVIPMTATHAYRGNTPIIIASSVAIHQAGMQATANVETRAPVPAAPGVSSACVKSMRVKIRLNERTVT